RSPTSARRRPRPDSRWQLSPLAMRVGIDLTALLPIATGVDRCLENLVLHLGQLDRDTRYTIFMNHEDRHRFDDVLPSNFGTAPLGLRPRGARLLFQQLLLPAAAAVLRLDVLHSPSFFMPLVRGSQRHLLSVYDVTMFTMPAYHTALRRSAPFRRGVALSLRRADIVCVPSHFVE